MFAEYDVVELTDAIDSSLPAGTRGAVVIVYRCFPPEYEVEFVDRQGDTIAIKTVNESQLCAAKNTSE